MLREASSDKRPQATLTDIDLELEEILSEEYGAVAQIEKEYVKPKAYWINCSSIEKEVDKYEPDLSVLELLRVTWTSLPAIRTW